ncbi:MAG: T9SS type A sorting domain-containing protein [Bacteroidetes bacterium]|nr:T9SS type A sorting domain-containing protein [Bacteroidota bacterium]
MKQRILLVSSTAILLCFILTSNKAGTADMGNGNKTGGPGSNNQTCGTSGCHSSSIGTTTGSFEVRKKFKPDSNSVVNSYIPDSPYTVKFIGWHPTLVSFGFQLIALKMSDSSQAGSFSNLQAKARMQTLPDGKIVLENSDTISKAGGGFETVFTWKAPSKNTGQIRFYGALVAANGDGTPINDQASSTILLALAEAVSVSDPNADNNFKIYPNPVSDIIHVVSQIASNGNYDIAVYDVWGRKIMTTTYTVMTNTMNLDIDAKEWAAGTYQIHIKNGELLKTITVMKQ